MTDQQLPGDTIIDDRARRTRVLVATCVALMAVVASASGLAVAQQQLSLDLDASQSSVLWVINGYIVALAALLLPMGAVADRWGRKPVLVSGLIAFAAANAAAGFVEGVEAMIAARVLAGAAAAMVMPVTLSVITSSFPAEARSQAIGVWSAVAGGGGLLGMVAAALLSDVASWRWLFAVPVGLAVVGTGLALRAIPNSRAPSAGRFDALGAALSIAGVGGLILGLHEGPTRGWSDPLALAALLGGVTMIAAFAAHETRHPAPLLDLRELRDRRLATGSTTLLVVFAISGGIFVVLFPFLQAVLGWSALGSMLGLLPLIVLMMGASGLAPTVAARLGARVTMLAGATAMALGLALMAALVSVDGGYTSVLPGMLLTGLGMGLTMPPATEAITSALPDHRQGVASALNDSTRELGSAIGIALLGAVLAGAYTGAMKSAAAFLPPGTSDRAGEGIGRAFQLAAEERDPALATQITDAARRAFVEGWSASMWVGAGAMVALLVCLAVTSSRRSAPAPAPTT